jgi:hypothetical protein
MHQRSDHDAAWKWSRALMARLEGVFRPEELRDAFEVILEHVEQAISEAFAAKAREAERLNPGCGN